MIQNPNTFVQNFIDKRGKVFTGTIASNTLATLSNFKHKYAYVDIVVNDVSDMAKISFLANEGNLSYSNKTNPRYKKQDSYDWITLTKNISLNNTGIQRYIVDVSTLSSFIIYADYFSSDSADIDIYVTFSNDERWNPAITLKDDFFPYHSAKKGLAFEGSLTSSQIVNLTNVKSKYVHVDIYVSSASASQTIYILAGEYPISNKINPRFREVGSSDWRAAYNGDTLSLSQTGWKRIIVDASYTETIKMSVNNTNSPATVQIYISCDDVAGDQLKEELTDSFLPYVPQQKVGIIHSGVFNTRKDISYTNIRQKYLFMKVVVNTGGNGAIQVYNTLYTDTENAPMLRNYRTNLNTRIFRPSNVGIYYLYADISQFNNFKVLVREADTNPANADVYISFVDELPKINDLEKYPKHTPVSDNLYNGYSVIIKDGNILVNQFSDIIFTTGRYAVFYVNTKTVQSGSDRLAITWKDNNNTDVSYGVLAFNSRMSIPSYQNIYGIPYSYDNEKYKGYVFVDLYALNLNRIYSIQNLGGIDVDIVFVTQTSDITPYLDAVVESEQPKVLFANMGNARFLWRRWMDCSFGEYWVKRYNNTIYIGKDDNFEFVNTTVFGHGNIDLSVCPPTLVPGYAGAYAQIKTIAVLIGFADGTILRCDITDISSANTISNWSEPNFWEKKGTGRKIPTKNMSEVDVYHRYDTTLDNDRYNYNTVTEDGYIAFQGKARLRRLGLPAWAKKDTAIAQYDTDGRRCCVFVTDDAGVNFYALYDIVNAYTGMYERVLLLSSDINTSEFADYSSGLQLFKVNRNIPSSSNLEPTSRYTFDEITEFTIIKGTKTIINKANHGLNHLDMVVFTGGNGTDWSQLASDSPGENSLGGNCYYVEKIDNNSFYIIEYTGSYDNQLVSRHIHSVQEWHEGFIIGTGEDYPAGWFISLQRDIQDDEKTVRESTWSTYRLNSSENGVSRPCGIVADGAIQPCLIFGSDTNKMVLGNYDIANRTEKLRITSFGIYKIALKDIDDMTKAVRVCDVREAVLSMYKLSNVIVAKLERGGLAISFDNGEKWEYFQNPTRQHVTSEVEINGQYHGKIVIGDGYVLEYNK